MRLIAPLSRLRRGLALLALALLAACAALAGVAGASPPTLGDAKRAALEQTLGAQMAEYNVPGAIVGLWFPGIGDWVVGTGQRDLSTGSAPQATDFLRIGSITKSFTATAVLQLVDQNKLALGDNLSKYEPWVPGAKRISIRQLLNMTSGLYNFTDVPSFWTRVLAHPDATWAPRQMVALAIAHKAVFPPGRKYMYCLSLIHI